VYHQQFERVQHRFLSFVGFNLNVVHPPHDYDPVLQSLNIQSLTDRHLASDLSYLHNLISGEIDAPSLLQLVNFRVSSHLTQNVAPFSIPLCSTDYLNNETITRCMRQANL